MPKPSEVRKHLEGYTNEDEHLCVIIWGGEDVRLRAKDRGVEVTCAEANEIIELVKRRHDCEYGVSWDTIDCVTDMYLDREAAT